jgi:general stress protein 26
MHNRVDQTASIKKLGELIEGINIAMFTTIGDGALRSRPMATP